MPLFSYVGVDSLGVKRKGFLDAQTISDAKLKLYEQNIITTKILLWDKGNKKLFSIQTLAIFTKELHKLLFSGIPLYDALVILEEKYVGQKQHPILLDLCDQVKKGNSFSFALSRHEQSFDFLYCSMIKSAESSGSIESALEEIEKYLIKKIKLKKQLLSTLLYPAFLGGFCLLVVFALLFFVIPSLSELFTGKTLHPLTKAVLAISNGAIEGKWYLLSFIILFFSFVATIFFSPFWKKHVHKLLISLPLLKPLFIKISFIRFSRTFATLLDAGVSYLNAIMLSKQVMKHPILEEEIEVARVEIMEGKSLSYGLSKSPYIPSMVVRMLSIAEKGGSTSVMLKHIAEFYEDELEKNLLQITSLLQPVLLLILGCIIGLVVLAVLLPLTDVGSFIS